MTTARSATFPYRATTLSLWINRGLEGLWLLTVILVPLAFLGQGYAVSEAEIAYVEVPKIALLRTLAAFMAVLWSIEWAIQGNLTLASGNDRLLLRLRPSAWLPLMATWLRDRPTRWVFLAVWFYIVVTLLSTLLSGSFSVSLWGEIPGQDGYPAYTVIAYVLVFGTIATHLKTSIQLWRLLGAIVAMGVLVAGYAVFQNYGYDFLNLSEQTGGRLTAFMGNKIFAAAVMSMAIPVSLMLATITIRDMVWTDDASGVKAGKQPKVLALMAAMGLIVSIQLLGITFTLSRGPWVGTFTAVALILGLGFMVLGWRALVRALLILGVAAALALAFLQWQRSISILGQGQWFGGVIALAASFGLLVVLANWRNFGLAVLAMGLAVAVAGAILIVPSWLNSGSGDGASTAQQATDIDQPGLTQVGERFSSIQSDVLGGFVGGRGTHWRVSWRLIRERPWFEFDSLSLSWLRPLIGYGPDLFRFTYLLKSPAEGAGLLPLEPDHAHNYFIHQTVEQGYLGLLSSLGIFTAVFLAGGYQLLRRRKDLSHVHKLVLIGLLATLAGRFLEMMVGVARVSDLTVLWVLLAVFAALPATMQTPQRQVAQTTQTDGSGRRGRRNARTTPARHTYDWRSLWRLALVAWLIGGVGILTWVKSVNYVRAAVAVGEGADHFRVGDFQATLTSLNRAIELAPDVPSYYNYQAQTYLAFQIYQEATPEQQCSNRNDVPYQVCLGAQALRANLAGVAQSPFYYRSQWALANSAFNLKLNDEAVTFYRQALALVPTSWPIREEIATAYSDAGNPGAALQFLKESRAITGDKQLSVRNTFLQGIAYRDLGELEESVRWVEDGLAAGLSGVGAPKAHQVLTDLYAKLGWERGIEVYDIAIQRNPQDAGSYYNRGLAYFDRGQYEQAMQDYNKALDLEQLRPVYKSRAEAFLQMSELYQARQDYDLAIQFDPADIELYLGRARVNLLDGENEQAIKDFDTVITRDPTYSDALGRGGAADLNHDRLSAWSVQQDPRIAAMPFLGRGIAYFNLGQYQRSISNFDTAIRLDPQLIKAYFTRGRAYHELDRTDSAIVSYSQAIELDPKDPQPYYYRGIVHFNMGQYQLSIPDLGTAIRMDFQVIKAYFIRGRAYDKLDRIDLAIDSYSQVIELDPEDSQAYFYRGVAYKKQGDGASAIRDWDRAVGRGFEDPLAYLVLRDLYTSLGLEPNAAGFYLDRGTAYFSFGLYERTLQDLDNALGLDPQLVEAYVLRGKVRIELGEFQEAIVDLDQAIRLNPAISETYRLRGRAYLKLGQGILAGQDFEKADLLKDG